MNYSGQFKDAAIDITPPPSSRHWTRLVRRIAQPFRRFSAGRVLTVIRQPTEMPRLDRGWIIANHKLVSFHAAFLTSLLSISPHVASKFDVIRQMFLSVEVVISVSDVVCGMACQYCHPRDGALPGGGQDQQSQTGT